LSSLAVVNALVERGYDVTVLAADQWTYGLAGQAIDLTLTKMIDPAVSVYRWPFPLGPDDPLVNRWSQQRQKLFSLSATKQTAWQETAKRQWSRIWPEPDCGANFGRVYQPITAAARHLHRVNQFDLVMATAGPWVDFAVPLILGAFTGVPTVIIDRDAWLFDVLAGEPCVGADLIEPLLGQLLSQVTRAWYISEPIAELHRQRFAEHAAKIKVVPNDWDPEKLAADSRPPQRQGDWSLDQAFQDLEEALGWN